MAKRKAAELEAASGQGDPVSTEGLDAVDALMAQVAAVSDLGTLSDAEFLSAMKRLKTQLPALPTLVEGLQ